MNPLHRPENYSASHGNACGPNPPPSKKITHAVQVIDPGYCLDAPDPCRLRSKHGLLTRMVSSRRFAPSAGRPCATAPGTRNVGAKQ